MVETLGVKQALERFMARGEAWGCRLVAMAHPSEAFERLDGNIPALWLSSRERFPRFSERMIGLLDGPGRLVAIEAASEHLCKAALRQIHVCMMFQSVSPLRSDARRLRKEAKLAKGVSRLIRAACSQDGSREPALADAAAGAAMRGLARGLDAFVADNPVCSMWVRALEWEGLARLALARAESKMIKAEMGPGGVLPEAPRRRL